MQPPTEWVQALRGVILVLVWAVLFLRVPAAWHARQRPAWAVLVAVAAGSVVIQNPVAETINAVVGAEGADELATSLVALSDFAVVWWFALVLHSAGHSMPRWLRRAPLFWALGMAVLAVFFFVITPAPYRFGSHAESWWVGYAIAWCLYSGVTTTGAAVLFWWHGVSMRNRVLRASILALAVGTTAELPYLIIRGVRWFVAGAPPELAVIGFWCSFLRFVLVALGCSLAVLEPLGKAGLHWYQRQRLHGLWELLREATPELIVARPVPRRTELLTVTGNWERLHQHVVEIHDSIWFLHNGWASPELARRAGEYADGLATGDRRRRLATACWLEVARRAALAGTVKLYLESDPDLVPAAPASESATSRDTRELLALHRALRSHEVGSFAERTPLPTPPAS